MKRKAYFLISIISTLLAQIVAVIALFEIGCPGIGMSITLLTFTWIGTLVRGPENDDFPMIMMLVASSIFSILGIWIYGKFDALYVALGLFVTGLCIMSMRTKMRIA